MGDIRVTADGWLAADGHRLPCALGFGGRRRDKREGDGATPVGAFALRGLFYRADRMAPPPGGLLAVPIAADLGWCDDPADLANYNRPVRLPHPTSAERMFRADGLYDIVIPLGYNDAPAAPGLGSAIFLHVARPQYTPTEGCVALSLAHLLRVVARRRPGDRLIVEAP